MNMDTDMIYPDTDTNLVLISEAETDTALDNYSDPDMLIFRISEFFNFRIYFSYNQMFFRIIFRISGYE